jgi:hypothetical protein
MEANFRWLPHPSPLECNLNFMFKMEETELKIAASNFIKWIELSKTKCEVFTSIVHGASAISKCYIEIKDKNTTTRSK